MKQAIDYEDIQLYTIADIQRIFNLGRTSAYQLMNASGFPTIRLNKKMYVPVNKLNQWIEKQTGKTFNY